VEEGIGAMKTIHVEFVGGLWDGQVLHGDSLDQEESKLAKKCFWGTKEGTVGTRVPGLSAQETRRYASSSNASPGRAARRLDG